MLNKGNAFLRVVSLEVVIPNRHQPGMGGALCVWIAAGNRNLRRRGP
jgi:hypothetical protein